MRSIERLLSLATLLLLLLAPVAYAQTAYVSDEGSNVIHVIQAPRWQEAARIPVGKRPRGMQLSHDGRHLYVALGNDDRIDVIDLATRKVVDHLPSGPDPERFVVSPDGRWLYVANENDSTVSFVDIAAKKIAHEVPVGAEPEGMAVSPDGHWVMHLREREPGPLHRCGQREARRQRAGGHAPARCRVQRRWAPAVGVLGDARDRRDLRDACAHGAAHDRFRRR